MEEHRDFAAGKQSIYSRFSACKLWRLLAERLNAAADDSGGARKSPDKWCRVNILKDKNYVKISLTTYNLFERNEEKTECKISINGKILEQVNDMVYLRSI